MGTMGTGELSAEDWAGAAWLLRCDVNAMKAVGIVETGSQGAFNDDGRPTILFERHYFHRLTNGKYDAIAPDLSNKVPGGYGHYSEQWPKLERAKKLDDYAAQMSASWGLFQIMGANYSACGYNTVAGFVKAMSRDVSDHLRAFACFVHSNRQLEEALRSFDWTTFSRMYNGPGFKGNPNTDDDDYDRRLALAYQVAQTVHP